MAAVWCKARERGGEGGRGAASSAAPAVAVEMMVTVSHLPTERVVGELLEMDEGVDLGEDAPRARRTAEHAREDLGSK